MLVGLSDVGLFNVVDWRYRITNKLLYQIIETTSREESQNQRQLKRVVHVTRSKDNDIIKKPMSDITSDKSQMRKPPTLKVIGLEKLLFLEKLFKKSYCVIFKRQRH